MPADPPFLDPTDRSLDTDQILYEAIPIASLAALFAGIALIPLLVATFLGPSSIALLFTVLAQFVAAVGTGIVLLYILVRAEQLA
jgi:hypothetical protein